ncbi:MAG: site-specific integrase, partial [Acidimicrobiia bacterium]
MSPPLRAASPRPIEVLPEKSAERIWARIDPGFLAELGWDPDRRVLCPPDGHRLVVRPVCRVEGCSTTAPSGRRICLACQRRLTRLRLSDDEIGLLPPPDRSRQDPGPCRVLGCGREWVSSRAGLCRAHLDQHQALSVEMEAFLAHPAVVGLAPNDPCQVAACTRQRRHADGLYCEAHQIRLRLTRRRDPGLDEVHWRRTEPAVGLGGQVSLRGLPSLVVAQVLFGLQQRCRVER